MALVSTCYTGYNIMYLLFKYVQFLTVHTRSGRQAKSNGVLYYQALFKQTSCSHDFVYIFVYYNIYLVVSPIIQSKDNLSSFISMLFIMRRCEGMYLATYNVINLFIFKINFNMYISKIIQKPPKLIFINRYTRQNKGHQSPTGTNL